MKYFAALVFCCLCPPAFANSCAVVDANGNVINMIMCDPTKDVAPSGDSFIDADGTTAYIGGTYTGGQFSSPPSSSPSPPNPVSCPAGTVNTSTEVITSGLVTHC